MRNSKSWLWLLAVGAGLAGSVGTLPRARAQEEGRPIRFPRHPSLSPDGKQIAFSYQGDIWTVSAEGGTASRLTLHEAHDQLPAWSPDGRWIAFSSKREGNYDVWLMPVSGGRPRQLTFHTGDDLVSGWSADGTQVLFTSIREAGRMPAVYAVPVETGASRLLASDDFALANGALSPDGKWLAATLGGSWTRPKYRGSASANLMLFPTAGGPGQFLTRDPENERWPLFSRDGRALYFVSDRTGTANLWKLPLDTRKPEPLTRFTEGSLFYPTLAAKADRLVFERNWSLWTVSPRGGEAKELKIYAPSDDRTNPVRRENFTTGAQEAVLSPDGKQLAFVVHGEVYVQPGAGGEATRLTETPQREQDITWSPDSASLAYSSDRDGSADLFLTDVKTKQTRQLTQTPDLAEHTPRFSPDGKTLAYLRGMNGTELALLPVAGGLPKVLLHDPAIGGPAWSPDGKWLAYHRLKAHSAGSQCDVFLIAAAGGEPVNVSRYPVLNSDPVWSADGKRLFFLSNRTEDRNVWSVALQEDEDAKPNPADLKIDLEDLHRRAKQVTRVDSNVSDFALSPDGKTVVFGMNQLGKADLWRVGAEGGSPVRLTQSGDSADGLQFAADGTRVVYLSGGGIKSLPLAATATGSAAVPFSARMEIETAAELAQLFDEAWLKMRDSFYDEKLHGADWNAVRARYRPVVQDITYKEDFYVLFSLVLGELNASHTGIGAPRETAGPATASLGVLYDDTYPGPGVKVKTVLPKGPADREGSRLVPGDLVLKLDGQPVKNNEHLYQLLTGKAGKSVDLLVNREPKEADAHPVKLKPIALAEYTRLAYEHWTREREQATEKLSGGKLGYVHLNAMDNPNLEKFKRAVFSDFPDKDGLVLDLRFNGGGAIADEILAILQDKVFSYRTVRGDSRRLNAPLLAWTAPVIVLINQASFSNAEAFPWGFKALKLGKVVGVPTYGAVIGTGGTTLIDGSTLRIPAVGAFTLDGINMENNGCPPDVYVENTPEDVCTNHDRQLQKAVEELLKQVGKKG